MLSEREKMMNDYEFHEAADIFPLLEGKAYEKFKDDIKKHGLREAVMLYDEKIIDGRNRYRVCKEEGIPLKTETWKGNGSPVDFVLSRNLHRRHLTASQRAMVAARARKEFEKEAAQRKADGQKKGGEIGGRGQKIASSSKDEQAISSSNARGLASRQAGQACGVSASSVDRARQVIGHGAQVLVDAVDKGKVSIAAAAKVAEAYPKSKQTEIVQKGPKAVTTAAKKTVAKKKTKRSVPEVAECCLKNLEELKKIVTQDTRGTKSQKEEVFGALAIAVKKVKFVIHCLT